MKVLLIYQDDDNKVVTAYATIIEFTLTYVQFDNGTNRITIPIHRLLKIKENSTELPEKIQKRLEPEPQSGSSFTSKDVEAKPNVKNR